tara:strand:+ start:11052 stop:12140 length:1089 start_codon:yes stop_codon:yes gene_type:complete
MSERNFWTDEQVAFLVVCRTKRQTWEQIALSMESKFGFSRSPSNIANKYRSLFDGDHAKEYTPEQSKFIIDCYLNHFQTKVILEGYFEQFGQTINPSDIDKVVKKHLTTEKKVDAEIKTIKTKIKERKKMKTNRTAAKWSKEEDEMIMACKSRKEALSLQIGRTQGALRNRWQNLKVKAKAVKPVEKVSQPKKGAKRGRMTNVELEMIRNCKTVEEALALNLRKPETIIRQFATFNSKKKEVVLAVRPKQNTHGNKGRKYTPRWTKEQDYDLILNFYELSIDEARNRFNRPYGVIASRLEKLVDSTKPEHISMLMEASKEIKSRKKAQNPTPKKSRRTLRKERKKAKKEAKLKAKLQKIRGE